MVYNNFLFNVGGGEIGDWRVGVGVGVERTTSDYNTFCRQSLVIS